MKTLTGYTITCPCCKDEREITRFGMKGLEKEYAVYCAAPELLEACKAIALWLIAPATDPKTILEMNTIVRTAIKKAEGNA